MIILGCGLGESGSVVTGTCLAARLIPQPIAQRTYPKEMLWEILSLAFRFLWKAVCEP